MAKLIDLIKTNLGRKADSIVVILENGKVDDYEGNVDSALIDRYAEFPLGSLNEGEAIILEDSFLMRINKLQYAVVSMSTTQLCCLSIVNLQGRKNALPEQFGKTRMLIEEAEEAAKSAKAKNGGYAGG